MNHPTKNLGLKRLSKTSKLDAHGQHWKQHTERRETKKTHKNLKI
jgi:hypothetical protein